MSAAPQLDLFVRTWTADVEPWIVGVLDGSVLANDLVRAAVRRHVNDLATGPDRGLWFDVEAADARLAFCALQNHVEGRLAHHGFVPEPAQAFILGSVHGWKRSDGRRRFTTAYIEVGKKFGKTFMISGEGLWLTGFDGEEGAKVFSIATKEEQAKLSWEPARRMIELSEDLQGYYRLNAKRIIDDASGSYWAPLGRDTDSEDGKNPSGLLVDELHRHPDGELYNTVQMSMSTRVQPLVWIITTAGAGRESFCWSVHRDSENIIRGIARDDSTFAFIATRDEDDDWRSETAWRKANPNIGVTVSLEFVQELCEKAKRNPRLENDFRRFYCNEWTETAVRWIKMEEWDACSTVQAGNWEAAEVWRRAALEALRREPCYTGLDLGRTNDLCASVHLFRPRAGRAFLPSKWIVIPHFWLPSAKIDPDTGEADGVPFRTWERLGFLTIVEGNAITSEDLEEDLVKWCDPFRVVELPYDPAAGGRDTAVRLANHKLNVIEFGQGWMNISPAAKKLESLVLLHEIEHGANPVLRWNAGNAAVKTDSNENLRPTKAHSSGRMDGISALINAIGRAMLSPEKKVSVYERRGVIHL